MIRTAQGMYQFSLDNGFGKCFTYKSGLKNFSVIENMLQQGEIVKTTFVGSYSTKSDTVSEDYAYALTNRRIIYAQKGMMGERSGTILYDNLSNISVSVGSGISVISIDTTNEEIRIKVYCKEGRKLSEMVHNILYELKSSNSDPQPAINNAAGSPVAQVKELKELFDMGIITQDEFNKKKIQLLGL